MDIWILQRRLKYRRRYWFKLKEYSKVECSFSPWKTPSFFMTASINFNPLIIFKYRLIILIDIQNNWYSRESTIRLLNNLPYCFIWIIKWSQDQLIWSVFYFYWLPDEVLYMALVAWIIYITLSNPSFPRPLKQSKNITDWASLPILRDSAMCF